MNDSSFIRDRRAKRELPALRSTPVLVAISAIIAAFIATLVYTQYRLRHIDDQASEILKNALPSVEILSQLRSELRRMGSHLDHYVDGGNGGSGEPREAVRAARRAVDDILVEYEALPFFPGEVELFAEALRHLALFDESVEKVLDDVARGDRVGSSARLYHEVHPRLDALDEAITRMKVFDTHNARIKAEGIFGTVRSSVMLALLLGIATVALAGLASALVVHSLRSQARLMAEHGRLLSVRAAEMEAFAGRVAHDLRNPLANIALRVGVIAARGDLDARAREGLSKLAGNVGRMNMLIDGLLEFATAGANPMQNAGANVKQSIDAAVLDLRSQVDAAQTTLYVDDASPDLVVACPPGPLLSVMSNLLGNAVKYIVETPISARQISVSVARRGDMARVEIADTGPGIPPGADRYIFEPFRRVSTTGLSGIGLGLATVKKIVEAYRGAVGVSTKHGKGSTFWFELPLTRAA
jgi:signal transduction histidine kinase